MNSPRSILPRFKMLILAAACGVTLTSCTIPLVGSTSIPEASTSLQVGVTTYSQLESQLGKPDESDQKGNRHTANWSSAGMGVSVGTLVGTGRADFHSLGVEYDRQGVVRRAVSHYNGYGTTVATPFVTSQVDKLMREPQRLSKIKHRRQLEVQLGPPQLKWITLEGEAWTWAGYPGRSDHSVLLVYFDRSGRVLKTEVG